MYRYGETENLTFVRSGSNVVISLLLQAVCCKVYLQVIRINLIIYWPREVCF